MKALKQHLERLAVAGAELTRVQSAVTAQRAALEAMPEPSGAMAALDQERADMLARMNLGEADPATMAAFDKTAAVKRAESDAQAAARRDGLAALRGLERRLDAAEAAWEALAPATREHAANVALAELEEASAAWVQVAHAEKAARERMNGLDHLSRTYGGHPPAKPDAPPSLASLQQATEAERKRLALTHPALFG